ncbi:MAG TPA: hypothetical protein VHS09_07040 [Polyangiaceae bacterium]|jgi:hypothetical protein|nr:hypothetical protein [Polyangiaceae bacterium]
MRPRLAFLLAPLFATFVFIACQSEGEGQPCDTNAGNSGNDDCQPPLVCTTGLQNANSPRCCPQDRSTAKTPECSLSSTTLEGGNPAPPDASPDSSTADGGSPEGSADGPAEGASETGDDTGTGVETGMTEDASDGATAESSTSDGPVEASGD